MLVFSQKILNLGVCLLDSRWAFHFFYNTDIIVCMLDWSGPLRLMGDGGGGDKALEARGPPRAGGNRVQWYAPQPTGIV